jgi:dTDP-4-amino-4,6-dideoxygalactose transaminase
MSSAMNKKFSKYLAENNYLFTGRGTTCLYLILKANKIEKMGVLVPANICYAAILAIIYAGYTPVFIDVGSDGNINYKMLQKVDLRNVGAAIIPHMYGNPCVDIPKIALYLKKRGVLFIEDCALAMGAEASSQMVGNFGDYAIFSFGYSKTVDVGYGGLLVTKRDLSEIEKENEKLNYYDVKLDEKLKLFSQLYSLIRYDTKPDFIEYVYKGFYLNYKDCFLFRSPREHNQNIIKQIGSLGKIIKKRRDNVKLYERELNPNDNFEIYKFDDEAVPWRFNLLIKEKYKKRLLKYLLVNKVPVSDWYPVVAPIFGIHTPFPHVQAIEKRILNFPLIGLNRLKIQRIANKINEFFKKES